MDNREYWYSQFNMVEFQPYVPATQVVEAISEAKSENKTNEG